MDKTGMLIFQKCYLFCVAVKMQQKIIIFLQQESKLNFKQYVNYLTEQKIYLCCC